MDLGTAGLRQQPFPTHGKPLAVVSYQARRDALYMLDETLEHARGVSLLQGPSLSGKSILVRGYLESIGEERAVALVDGKGLNTTSLLLAILRQFGYEIDLNSANELLGLVRIFVLQQASTEALPLLIVDNAHELKPSAWRTLSELADLRVRTGSALKMVLVSDESLTPVLKTPAMRSIERRILHDFHMRPMTRAEATQYVYEKLTAAGTERPAQVFPENVCGTLWEASGGWPGILDRIALLAMAGTDALPVSSNDIEFPSLPVGTWDEAAEELAEVQQAAGTSLPKIVVSENGNVIEQLVLDQPRLLIGRSIHNDITIGSRFVSRHHALLTRYRDATLIMDLNSTNGTFVNASRVTTHVLLHDDVVTIGHHKIKYSDPDATMTPAIDDTDAAATAVMRTLEDMRNLLADDDTESLPMASDNIPTLKSQQPG